MSHSKGFEPYHHNEPVDMFSIVKKSAIKIKKTCVQNCDLLNAILVESSGCPPKPEFFWPAKPFIYKLLPVQLFF